jgi:adenosylmethionine-8-amino-7-oxononanoate aminotransferase
MTGFHRTGRRFACDHWDVQPDLVCVGKALTSGFPLAACVGRAAIMDAAWPESEGEALHTSTFLGNPLGCRMALESLELLEAEPWSEKVNALGSYLEKALRRLQSGAKNWGAMRGLGLMRGLEVVDAKGAADAGRAGKLVEAMLARGVILLSGGVSQNVLSFMPPFVITTEEIDFALAQLEEAAQSFQ